MNPLQTELLARDHVASTLRLMAQRPSLPDPGRLPPRRGPLASIAAVAADLGARARATLRSLPSVRIAL